MTFDINRSTLSTEEAEILQAALKITKRRIGVEEVILIRPDFTIRQAEALLVTACRVGLLEVDEPFYGVTEEGRSFLQTGLRPRFDRVRADQIIAKAIEAARKWNKNRSRPAVITELRLFGSTLGDRESYGDVDIEIHTAYRDISQHEMSVAIKALPKKIARSYEGESFPELMAREHSARAARNAVKRAAKEIAITREDTIRDLGADYMQIFSYDITQEAEVAAEMVYHPRKAPRATSAPSRPVPSTQILPPSLAASFPEDLIFWTSALGSLADKYWRGTKAPGGKRRVLKSGDVKHNRDDMRAMVWFEGCPAWEINAENPFQAMAELHQTGLEIGALGEGNLIFHVEGNEISIEFPAPLGHQQDLSIMFIARVNGANTDLNLIPLLVPAGRGCQVSLNDYGTVLTNALVSIGRSAARPLAAIYKMLAPAPAVAMKLSFSWNPRNTDEVKLPRLQNLMNAMKFKNIEMREDDLSSLHALAIPELERNSYALIEISQTLEIEMSYGAPYINQDLYRDCISYSTHAFVRARVEFGMFHEFRSLYDVYPISTRLSDFGNELSKIVDNFHLELRRKDSRDIMLNSDEPQSMALLARNAGIFLPNSRFSNEADDNVLAA